MTRVRSALGPMRQPQGIQPRELVARVGIGRQALSELEAGKACPSTAVALALRFNVEDQVRPLRGCRTDSGELGLSHSRAFRCELESLEGYATGQSGQVVAEVRPE
jgi:DNA-binding XRE family transcriptional regulator